MPRDWTEDAIQYMNNCRVCGEQFLGFRWRVICRECVGGDDA